MPSTRNLHEIALLFNYIKYGSIVPLSCSVIQIVIYSSISTSKEGRNVQFIRFSMLCSRHGTPNKRHPRRGLHRENIFRHAANFLIFDTPCPREVRPVMQSTLHSVPLKDQLFPRQRSLEKIVVKDRSLHRNQLRSSAMPIAGTLLLAFNYRRTHWFRPRLTRKSRSRPRRHHPGLNRHVIP